MLIKRLGRWLFPVSYFFPIEEGLICFDKEGDGDGGGGGDGSGDGSGDGGGDGGSGDGKDGKDGDGGDGSGDGGDGGDPPDLDKLPKETQDYIKRLRGENAKRRKENKALTTKVDGLGGEFKAMKSNFKKALGLGDDDEQTPEEKAESLAEQNNQLAWDSNLKDLMIDNGITKESKDYFEFLIQKAAQNLKEDEELDDDQIAAIAQEAKVKSGVQGDGTTSVGDGGKDKDGNPIKPKPKEGSEGDASLDDFCSMSMLAKGKLYESNPNLYSKLVEQAKAANRLV